MHVFTIPTKLPCAIMCTTEPSRRDSPSSPEDAGYVRCQAKESCAHDNVDLIARGPKGSTSRMLTWSNISGRTQLQLRQAKHWNQRVCVLVVYYCFAFLFFCGDGFASSGCHARHHGVLLIQMINDDSKSSYFNAEFDEGDDEGHIMPDLDWRVAKAKLEEANIQRFLKARARFIPYVECRKWAIATGRFDCEQDWRDFVSLGEGLNTYIPSAPDEYYARLGQWISWEHFLGKCNDDDVVGTFD